MLKYSMLTSRAHAYGAHVTKMGSQKYKIDYRFHENNPKLAPTDYRFQHQYNSSILQASDYWMQFEYQHRGSPHVHGVVWLQDAPDVEQVLSRITNEESSSESSSSSTSLEFPQVC